MAGYTYDTSGQSYFFLLTVLLLVLLPFTYATLFGGAERAAAHVKAPCTGWNRKTAEARRAGGAKGAVGFRHALLAIGWLAFAVVVQRARMIEGESAAFDPFTILGVSSSATEKQIKKHYRRLSLKFHPDKLVLAENQTKEEADSHFVELTKAYKALTDDVSRRNYELYGHPDGKQEFSSGIALPAWIVESKNSPIVIGAYALLLGVVLPVLVGRWWYGTRKLTKDGVLNSTAAKYFHALKEETTFPQLLDILASSDEFAVDPKLLKLRKSPGKAAVDEYARLVSTVREGVDGKAGWEGYATWTPAKKRARVMIAAYLLRLPLKDTSLLKEKYLTASIALPLCSGLASIALAHNWLSTYISILHLQQFLLQAVHPSSSQLLQLPHITPELAARAQKLGVETVQQFGELKPAEVEKILAGLPDAGRKDAYEVARSWPVVDFVGAKFEVAGEKVVTPGAIVSFVLKLRLAPPGSPRTTPEVVSITHDTADEGDEQSIEELIGRRSQKDEGVVPTPLAHAPHFPKNRKPAWHIFVGDHKLNRVFVAPHRFTDMGTSAVRTVRMSFQAPPGPGLYTFQVYVASDSFVGASVQKDMRMKVEPPREGDEADEEDEDDDISEPEEDSLAGQMALMKGQPVKRRSDSDEEDDDDDSETESESESESSSDSDSDSD
ncbi:secretory subunit [Rhodotorula kratochvilovae]